MRPPSEHEIESLSSLLRQGTITSRAALLVVLLKSDTGSYQMVQLAAELSLSVPGVSMLGVTLVKLGLVDRCVPASDMRKVSLALTQKGYATARAHLGSLRGFTGGAVESAPHESPAKSE